MPDRIIRLTADGKLVSVYDDKLTAFLDSMGRSTVERATSVEFDNEAQEWVATHRSGERITNGQQRSQVITTEVEWLNRRLLRGEEI